MTRDTVFAVPTSWISAKGRTTGNVAATTIRNIARAASRSSHPRVGRAGTEDSATIRPRIASTSACETRLLAARDSNRSRSLRPVSASGAARTDCTSASDLPRSVTVRTRYMIASTRPHARLQPKAATNISRICSRPAPATDTAPTKVSAMNKPKSISDTRSTGLSTESRVASSGRISPFIAIAWRLSFPARPRVRNRALR